MGKKQASFKEVKISADEPVYTSGVVSKLLGIPVWILKQLDREEIIIPLRGKDGGRRLYSRRELKNLGYIWYLMNKRGVNVRGLKVILEIQGVGDGESKRKRKKKKVT